MNMKTNLYLLILVFLSFVLNGCDDKFVYNTRVVSTIELIGIEEDYLLFSKGESGVVKIKMLPVDAIDKSDYTFVYESSDSNVFTVDSEGNIQAITPGEGVLFVQSVNNSSVSLECKVIVQPNWIRTIEVPQEYKNYNLVQGNTLDLGSVVTIKPEAADNPLLNYTSSNPDVASVDANGVVTGNALGDAEIIIQAADGGGATLSVFIHVTEEPHGDFPRGVWDVTASHPYVPDKATGRPEDILDNIYSTFLSIRKPGKGTETPAGATIFFTVDMGQKYAFNYFRWHHRGDNVSTGLRAERVDLYGSQNGTDFAEIQKDILLDVTADAVTGEKIQLRQKVSYRYVRFVISGYSTSSGSAVQISEIFIGNE